MAVRLDWRGEEWRRRVDRGARLGLEETAAACIAPAMAKTPRITGTLQGSIKVDPQGVQERAGRLSILWGSFDVNYAKWVELGTSKMLGKHMMTSAAEQEYPSLAQRIQRRL